QESEQGGQDGGGAIGCMLLWRAGRGHSPWRAQGRKASESDDDREPGIAFRTCSKVPSRETRQPRQGARTIARPQLDRAPREANAAGFATWGACRVHTCYLLYPEK